MSERHSHVEPGLGRVEELYQRFSVGDDITVQAHWLLDSPAEAARPQHLLHVELGVDGESVRVRRGQMDSMRKALELADYLFATIDREELGRRTC